MKQHLKKFRRRTIRFLPLILVILFCIKGYSQSDTSRKCPLSWSWMPTLSTSSLMIEANKCLPDSICKKLFKLFSKNMCGEMGLIAIGFKTSYYRTGAWSDSCGCIYKEQWQKIVKKKWVNISKEEYENLNK